jgi:DNA-directed RNA polymerase subunit RPC12/RpoP
MMFKACARCRGDLYREEDLGQAELVCLQCGFRLHVAAVASVSRFTMQRREAHRKGTTSQPVRAAA